MSSKIAFFGNSISIPGAYSYIDTSGMASRYDGSVNVLAILGESTGGEPGALNFIDEPSVGRKILKGGELLKACEKAWNPVSRTKPGVAIGGATRICAIRTNQATKSKFQSPNYLFQSKDWGKTTQYFITLADGSLDHTKSLVVYDPANDRYENYDNIGNLFAVKYVGDAEECILSITEDAEEGIHFKTKLGDVVTIPATEGEKAVGKIKFILNDVSEPMTFTLLRGQRIVAGGKEYVLDNDITIDADNVTCPLASSINYEDDNWTITAVDEGADYNFTNEVVENLATRLQDDCGLDLNTDLDLVAIIDTDGGMDAIPERQEMMYFDDLDLTIDKHNYHDYRRLANDIASYAGYVIDTKKVYNSNLSVYDIDPVDEVNIKDSNFRLTAIGADLKNKLDNISEMIEIDENYEKTVYTNVSNIDYVQLSGGEEGISPVSWIKFFDSLSQFSIDYIVPLTDDMSVHAELYAHCVELSGIIGKERRGIVGGHAGETVEQTCDRARLFQDARMQVVHGGFYDYNQDNELELYPPYILAAAHGGRAAFLEDGEPATHDVYRMAAPEYKLERNEITQLLDAGALAFEWVLGDTPTDTPYCRLVQDLTTDTLNGDSIHTERATGHLADSIMKEIRRELDYLLTGKRTAPSDMETAKNRIVSILSNRLRKNHIVAYKNIYLTKTGTATYVYMSIAPAEPNNFTLITAYFYSETLTASDAGESNV